MSKANTSRRPKLKPKAKSKAKAKPKTKAKATPTRKRKAPKPKATKKAKRPRRTRAAAALVPVTMTITFPDGAPGDVQFVRRIDSVVLPNGKAKLNHGQHTTSWNVISPTVRPIAYSVKITEDLTGNVLFDRPNQQTGPDGLGGGADTFGV